MNNFDLKKYLVENKVTKSSQLEEAKTMGQIGDEIEELEDIKIRYEKKGDYDRAAKIEDKIESLKSEFKNLINEESNTNKAYVVIGFFSNGVDINDNTVKVFTDFSSAENYFNQLEGSPMLINTTIN
jgi:hypothetical protein